RRFPCMYGRARRCGGATARAEHEDRAQASGRCRPQAGDAGRPEVRRRAGRTAATLVAAELSPNWRRQRDRSLPAEAMLARPEGGGKSRWRLIATFWRTGFLSGAMGEIPLGLPRPRTCMLGSRAGSWLAPRSVMAMLFSTSAAAAV